MPRTPTRRSSSTSTAKGTAAPMSSGRKRKHEEADKDDDNTTMMAAVPHPLPSSSNKRKKTESLQEQKRLARLEYEQKHNNNNNKAASSAATKLTSPTTTLKTVAFDPSRVAAATVAVKKASAASAASKKTAAARPSPANNNKAAARTASSTTTASSTLKTVPFDPARFAVGTAPPPSSNKKTKTKQSALSKTVAPPPSASSSSSSQRTPPRPSQSSATSSEKKKSPFQSPKVEKKSSSSGYESGDSQEDEDETMVQDRVEPYFRIRGRGRGNQQHAGAADANGGRLRDTLKKLIQFLIVGVTMGLLLALIGDAVLSGLSHYNNNNNNKLVNAPPVCYANSNGISSDTEVAMQCVAAAMNLNNKNDDSETTPEQQEQLLQAVSSSITLTPCPTGGMCQGGQLVACNEPFDLSAEENGGAPPRCVLNEQAHATLDQLQRLVSQWTVEQLCSKSKTFTGIYSVGNNNNNDENGIPLFPMSQLMEQHAAAATDNNGDEESSSTLSWLQTALEQDMIPDWQIQMHENELFVGVKHLPMLPASCVVADTIVTALQFSKSLLWKVGVEWSLVWAWKAIWFLVDVFWGVFHVVPGTVSVVIPLLIALIGIVRNKRRRRKEHEQLQVDVQRVEESVFEHLIHYHTSWHKALAMRQMVQDNLFASANKKDEQWFLQRVWPHVVRRVEQEDRIHKRDVTEKNVIVTTWKWVG